MADRRKHTDSDIIADEKLLAMVEAASHLPTQGSRHFAATVMQCNMVSAMGLEPTIL